MSLVCPPKNQKDWIDLENLIGEKEAYRAFILNGYNVPTILDITSRGLINPENILKDSEGKLDVSDYKSIIAYLNSKGALSFIEEFKKFVGKPSTQPSTPIKPGVEELFDSNPELANSVYEALGFGINKLTDRLKNPSYNSQKEYYLAKDVESLLLDISKFTTDNDTKLLVKALLQIPNINKIGLNVTKFNKETKDKGIITSSLNVLGTYNSFSNLIQIIGTLDKETFERVFLHEVIHGITVNEYYTNKEFTDKINKLYNYALKFKDYKTSKGVLLGEMYGMKNPKEFMSEAMTNPDFIYELSKYYSPSQEKLKEKNIFQEFIELIVNTIKEKITSKGKKYIENNLGTTVLNTISNYANIKSSNFKSVSKLENNQITQQQKQQALQLYSAYIDSIFPDSKVKDIVYHGTEKSFEQFSKDAEKATIADQGVFFAPTRNQARNSGKVIVKAVINSNPLISDNRIERISEKKKQELLSQGYNGYVYSYNKTISSADDIVVFEPEQIHILGSKQDIEGFKEFVSKGINNNNIYVENADLVRLLNYKYPNSIYVEPFGKALILKPNSDVTVFNQFSEQEKSYYVNQLLDYTEKNNEEVPLALNDNIIFDGEFYVNVKTKQVYKRVSELLEEIKDGYFKFEGDSEEYEVNRIWGNQTDFILKSVLTGKDLKTTIKEFEDFIDEKGTDNLLSDEVVEELYNTITKIKEDNPKSVILSQVIFKNDRTGIAGTADIVIVNPDGSIKIKDLKTSKTSTESYKYSSPYTKGKSSKSERHAAQLSAYKGLALSEGYDFEGSLDDLSIIPLYIQNESNNIVTELKLESEIPHETLDFVVEEVYTEYEPERIIDEEKYNDILDKIKIVLERRLAALRKSTVNKKNKFEKYKIEELKKILSSVEKTKSISTFITNMHETFIQKDKYPGIYMQYRKFKSKLDYNTMTPSEVIEQLMEYKNHIDTYKGFIEELEIFYTDLDLDSVIKGADPSSPLGKLRELTSAFKWMEKDIQKSLSPTIAKELNKFASKEGNEKVLEEIKYKKERLKQYKEDSKAYKIISEQIRKLEEDIGLVNEETLTKTLEFGANQDIPYLDFLLNPAISSSNPIVALFAKKLKLGLENARQKSIAFSRDAVSAFNKFKGNRSSDNVAEFNRGLYEKVMVWDDYNKKLVSKMAFVQDYDVTAYNIALNKMWEEANKINNPTKKADFINSWYMNNHEALPEEDHYVNGVLISKGRNSIIEEKKKDLESGILSKKGYDEWYSKNVKEVAGRIIYTRQLSRPSRKIFKSTKIEEMSSDQREYYNFLISSYFRAQNKIPSANAPGYILPSITKSDNDVLRENGVTGYLKHKKKELKSDTAEEKDLAGSKESIKTIPILFGQPILAEDTSVDLISSIMLYDEMANTYEVRSNISGFAEATLEQVSANQPLARDSKSNKIIENAAKKAGIEGYNQYLKKHNGNNVAALLESFIDMQVYGKLRDSEEISIFGKTVNISHWTDRLRGFASKTQIGGNPLLSVANSLTANVMVQIESAAKEFFSTKELAEAKAIYYANSGNYIKDFTEPINKSFIGQLIDLYDPSQGEFRDKYGRKVSQSAFKKLWSTDTWFFLQHQGEHAIQVQTMIAMLKRKKVTTTDGKTISLYDAYEQKSDGKIGLKEGVVISGIKSENGLISIDLQNSIHAINKRMHGVYNSFDQPELKRYWWGRLIMMYRDFLVPGIKKRYKSIGMDQELGNLTEGYYNTMYRLAVIETKEMLKELSPFHKSNLSPLERANLKRSVAEMGMILSTGLIVMLLTSMLEGDDDDKGAIKYAFYWAMRLNAELSTYGGLGNPDNLFLPDIKDAVRTLRSPTAANSTVERILKLIYQLGDPNERYERATGVWEKGDLKIEAALFKLLGITGNTLNPDEAIKVLQMQTK
jgi:hypothetical protein